MNNIQNGVRKAAIVAGDQVHDVSIAPATTTADVRRQAGLPDNYFISLRDGLPFGEHEVLYSAVPDGAKLYASPPANVAA